MVDAMEPTILLVHGAFHGAWCWEPVLDGLREAGIGALAVDLPGHGESAENLGGLRADADHLRTVLESCGGPVVLCGHSYGGSVISEAAERAHSVTHLVYIAGVMPEVGESLGETVPEIWSSPIAHSLRPRSDGTVTIDPSRAREIFYGRCPSGRAEWAVSRLGPQHPASFDEAASRTAWREIASTYVVCTEDRAIDVGAQERMAKRASGVVRWSTDHSPMLSAPDKLVGLLTSLCDL